MTSNRTDASRGCLSEWWHFGGKAQTKWLKDSQRLKDLATDCFGRVDSYQIRDMEKMKVSWEPLWKLSWSNWSNIHAPKKSFSLAVSKLLCQESRSQHSARFCFCPTFVWLTLDTTRTKCLGVPSDLWISEAEEWIQHLQLLNMTEKLWSYMRISSVYGFDLQIPYLRLCNG